LASNFNLWVDRFLTPIDDPGSRLFHVNLLMSLAFIVLWAYLSSRNSSPAHLWRELKRLVWRKKYWWNRSTRLDYKIYFFNSILKILLFIPFLDFSYRFAKLTIRGWRSFTGADAFHLPSTTVNVFAFTILAFVLDDFFRFVHHYLMHKVPWLWRLHKTHHSARILTPITLYRTHPLESAMATVRNSLATGIALGSFMFLFDGSFGLFTIFGINFFGFTFNFLASNLRHSHIDLPFGPAEWIFISPKQHQIHHSTLPAHFDKNFGVSLAIWDGLSRSLVRSRDVTHRLRFGLNDQHRQSFSKIIFKPK
jgi:sterol desaturase/sphingolipid hydroxylase (fatty acid hydroxylase superfamily)